MPPKKQKPEGKPAATKSSNTGEPAGDQDDREKIINEVLKNCCRHLNGLPGLIVDEVLARLPAYCEEHRVTMTARSRAKEASRKSPAKKSTKPSSGSIWG